MWAQPVLARRYSPPAADTAADDDAGALRMRERLRVARIRNRRRRGSERRRGGCVARGERRRRVDWRRACHAG